MSVSATLLLLQKSCDVCISYTVVTAEVVMYVSVTLLLLQKSCDVCISYTAVTAEVM